MTAVRDTAAPPDEALAAAFEIRSSAERDEALATLVRAGLARKDYRAAFDAANRVSQFTVRDEFLDRVSCHALAAGDLATVRKAAASVFSPSLRSVMARRIAPSGPGSSDQRAVGGSCPDEPPGR